MNDWEGNCDGADLTATWNEQHIEFRWRKIEGPKRYTLKLRHVNNRQHLIVDADVYQNLYKCKIADDIRYGQVYEMMVEFVWPSNEIRRFSEWIEFVLGGKTVPVYPTARLNLENPQRSMKLNWQNCEKKAEEYRITAIPSSGRIRKYTCRDCTVTITQLKSNTEYTFEVQALFEDNKEGPACRTDKVSTLAKPGSYLTTQSYAGIKGSTVKIVNPTSVHNSHITKVTDPDFGKARNVEMITRDVDGIEMAVVQWEEPLFHGERDDYEILQYKVTVKEGQNKIRDWICPDSHRTEDFMINLGKLYVVSIWTQFQEIDTEKRHCADFKEEFYSRPTLPKIKVTENINLVLVEWFCDSGAEEYRLEVYESKSLALTWEGNKSCKYKEIDKKKLSLGRLYKFRVIAFAKGRKSNDHSVTRIIGGDHVVRDAQACLNNVSPLDSVDISWQSPEISPKMYRVREVDNQSQTLETGETRCTVTGLLSGVRYQFEVIAVYDDHDGHPAKTNYVTTDPRPERISGVEWKLDDKRPDTCIHLNWTPSKSATMYKIRVNCTGTVREHDVMDEKYVLAGLKPDTCYKIYVSAGNDKGFGEECFVKANTEIEVPIDVMLTWDAESQILQAICGHTEDVVVFWNLYKTDGNLFVESNSSALFFNRFNLYEGNTKYYATVKFKREGKESGICRSNTMLTAPSQVRDVQALRVNESLSTDIHLEWKFSEDLSYEIEFETDHHVEAVIRSCDIGKCRYRCLQEGNEYSVRIRAQNATGYGLWSQKEYVSLAPPRIRNLTAVNTKDRLTVHWQPPRTERLRSAISHYILEMATGEHCEPDIKEIKETKSEISPYFPGKTYKFSVAAVDVNNIVGDFESGTVTVDTLAPPDYVLVKSNNSNPMRIHVSWPETYCADSYLVTFGEERHETDQTSWIFEDVQPKTDYMVQVFSKRACIVSETCTGKQFTTGDLCPVLYEDIEIENDTEEPWRLVTVKWCCPPGVSQFKVVRNWLQGSKELICKQNFVKLEHRGSNRLLHIDIHSAIPGFVNDSCTSISITMPEIPAIRQDSVKVTLDEEYPWKYANIQWELPPKLKCSFVTVESVRPTRSGQIVRFLRFFTSHTTLRFERKSKISTYSVRLQAGYYPDTFGNKITAQEFAMGPDSPEVTRINQVNNPRSKLVVFLNKQGLGIDKVILTASSENGTQKAYEHNWASSDCTVEITDLPPGHKYNLYVESFLGSHRRAKELIGTHELYPPVVQELEAHCTQRNTLVLKWLPNPEQNTNYRVRWNCANQTTDLSNSITCDVAEVQIPDLRIGEKYEATVCAYIGECYGPDSRVSCIMGWPSKIIFKKLVEKLENESESSVPLLPISLNVENAGVMSLSDVVEQYQKKNIVILGKEKSGKSTVCKEICKEIVRNKTRHTLPILVTSEEIFLEPGYNNYLDRQWNLDLTDFEKKSLKTWIQSHGEQITYVVDEILPISFSNYDILEFVTFATRSQSTIFFVGSSFNNHHGLIDITETSINFDYTAELVSQHLALIGPQKAAAWNEIREQLSDLCFSPKHFFAVIDFVKNDNSEAKFSSPAWVFAKVYQTLHHLLNEFSDNVDATTILNQTRSNIVKKIKQQSRLSDRVTFSLNVSELTPPASPDEKFLLALQAVYFSPPQVLLSLLKNCDDENILLLCADCIHESNRIEIFKLFPRETWEEANSKLESNISALESADPSFTPKLGREFRNKFNSAAGIRQTIIPIHVINGTGSHSISTLVAGKI